MIWVLLVCVVVLAYVFGGYPWLLRAIVAVRGPRTVAKAPITPPASLVISAFNETDVIAAKLDNALALAYPPGLLEIVVVSDASDDGTDAIVERYGDRGVRLFRQEQRMGKTAGLNAALPTLRGDIVVFSDANAMYRPDALRALVSNFADVTVGCVTGEARYAHGNASAADVGENVYWDYEMGVKRLETAVGSMVGGDGAIYAIRRALWKTLPVDGINDFLNPLQIVEAGYRNVYEPGAIAFEETAGEFGREYRRRVRIVSRSWRAVFQARGVLNPFRVGLFAFCLVSHKLLRWFSPFLVTLAVISASVVAWPYAIALPPWQHGVAAVLSIAFLASPPGRKLLLLASYFLVLNAASFVGLVKGTLGRVSGTWTPPRLDAAHDAPADEPRVVVTATNFIAVVGYTAITVALLQLAATRWHTVAVVAAWSSAGVLGYVYIGYPAAAGIWRRLHGRPPRKAELTPSVSVVIAAHDEVEVIAGKLHNTLASDYPRDLLDILVVSDGSTDGTDEAVAAFADAGVRLLRQPSRRGKISAINAGVATCATEVLVLTDANAFLIPGAIRQLVRNFADPEVGAVSGDVILTGERASLAASEDLYYGYERWLQHAESDIWSMIGVDGALYAIRRSAFQPQPADTILDDMAIPMAASKRGFRIVFEPEARAVEQGSFTAREEFARKTRVVAGAVQFLSRIDRWSAYSWPVRFSLLSHKALRWLTPMFLFLFYGATLSLVAHQPYRAIVALQTIGYGVGILGCHPLIRRIPGVGLTHYFCLVQAGAGTGLLRGILGRQRVTWRRFARGSDASRRSA